MRRRRLYQRTFALTWVVLLLAACGGVRAEPTATPTSVPPTVAPTAARPTVTPAQAFTLAASLEEIAGTTWRKTVGAGYLRFCDAIVVRRALRRDVGFEVRQPGP